ncbi:MAG: hypothetical protein J6X28_01160 [Bacilli bacterium]|nr:hypothetical protein [Bacilli bacterium]
MGKLIRSEEELKLRQKQITALVEAYYQKFDFLQYESLESFIDKALELFLDSEYSIDEINQKLQDAIVRRKKVLIARYDPQKVRENHRVIYDWLEKLTKELNQEGIDYQLAGALSGYIKYGEESDRVHDDIDIHLNEEDIGKFKTICERLGLEFVDDRMHSKKTLGKDHIVHGEHEVMGKDPHSDFHTGAFVFIRNKNDSVVAKNYFHDEDGAPCVQEDIYSPPLAEEVFGGEEVEYRGLPLMITPPEFVYRLKKYTRHEKDLHDILFLEERIDQEKLAKIEMLSKEGSIRQFVPVTGLPEEAIHNPFQEQNNELGIMMVDQSPHKEEEKSSQEKEGTKMLVKKNQSQEQPPEMQNQQDVESNEEGFISNTIITTLAIITFVLCFIGIAVIYLVQM